MHGMCPRFHPRRLSPRARLCVLRPTPKRWRARRRCWKRSRTRCVHAFTQLLKCSRDWILCNPLQPEVAHFVRPALAAAPCFTSSGCTRRPTHVTRLGQSVTTTRCAQVKLMNRMVRYAKCVTVRDKQVAVSECPVHGIAIAGTRGAASGGGGGGLVGATAQAWRRTHSACQQA
jgi:hypothetical protein